jgi:replicative superfamily II helicase
MARGLKRRLIARLGPTNSGKTYAALKDMAAAASGVYLAPLRLLALEKQEELIEMGIPTSLNAFRVFRCKCNCAL